MPVDKRLIAATLFVDVEVGKRVRLALNPDISNDVAVGAAHEVLEDNVDAVVGVRAVQLRKHAVRVPVRKVVPPVNVAADRVEAVHRVDNVELGNVGVGAEAPFGRPLGRLGRVLAETADVGGGDAVRELVRDGLPGGVGGGGRGLAVDRGFAVEERAVDGGDDEGDLDLVVDGGCEYL